MIGAGSKGEFREEDQICCAWIASRVDAEGSCAGGFADRGDCTPLAQRSSERVPMQPQRGLSAADEPAQRPGFYFLNTSTTCVRFSRFGTER